MMIAFDPNDVKWNVHSVNHDDDEQFDTCEEAADHAREMVSDGFSVVVESPNQLVYDTVQLILDSDRFKNIGPFGDDDELYSAFEERIIAHRCLNFLDRNAHTHGSVNCMTGKWLKGRVQDMRKVLRMFAI